MKTTTRQISVALLFLLTVLSTQAQKEYYNGYIVKETGDTLWGKVRFRETDYNPRKIFFRNEKDTLTLSVGDLKEFMLVRADGDTVVYRKAVVTYASKTMHLLQLGASDSALLARDTVFLELMVQGTLNLYQLKKRSPFINYYIQKDDSVFQELVFRKYYAQGESDPTAVVSKYKFELLRRMDDCPKVKPMIAKMRYREKDMQDIFLHYNTCQGKNTIKYIRQPEKLKFHVSIFGGFNSVWVKYTATTTRDKPKTLRGNGYAVGLGFNMGLTRDMPKLWLHTELGINAFHIKGTTPRTYSNFNFYTKNISLNLLYLKLRVLPTYYFGRSYSRFVPYINLGFVAGWLVKEIENKAYIGNNTDTNDPAVPNVKKYDLGFATSLGFRIYNYAGIEARYEFGDGFSYNKAYGAQTHSVLVTARINIGDKPQKKPL